MASVHVVAEQLVTNVEKVIIGKREAVELAIINLLCQGHLLIEDVPGTGKTVLAKSIAKSIGCVFRRIQFTPDMLPSDVTGVSVFNQKTREFEFREGPIFAQIVLADEVNRATPKTQAALLEAMEERQVTVDGVTRILTAPFLVLATQNPIEYEGTFPLPEAQLDRFMMRVRLGYPGDKQEVTILDSQQYRHPLEEIGQIMEVQTLLEAQEAVKTVYVDDKVKTYIVELVGATRKHSEVYLGASPRGSLVLYRTAQARAAMAQRDYVLPDDVKYLAMSVLAHRMIISPSARIKDITADSILQEIVNSIPVPGAVAGKRG
jgi:MoxR-like ATPase